MGCCSSTSSREQRKSYESVEGPQPEPTCSPAPIIPTGTGSLESVDENQQATPSLPCAQGKLSLVAAGHASRGGDAIKTEEGEDGKPGTILKILDKIEYTVYKRLSEEHKGDPVQNFIPEFRGKYESVNEQGDTQEFIRISNLLHGFTNPKVIDVKIGVRTFLEDECANAKLRPDLYEKMTKMYPDELGEEDHAKKGVTKHKWMTTRDKVTTISSLGYRVDGVAGYRRITRDVIDMILAKIETIDDASSVFQTFAEVAATDDLEANTAEKERQKAALTVAEGIHAKLVETLAAVEASPFVKVHEFIGSSILIVADAFGHHAVSWIDFAKTRPVDEGLSITHRDPWQLGNHEDGIIFGLQTLCNTWQRAVLTLKEEDSRGITSMRVSSYPEFKKGQRRGSINLINDLALLSSLPALTGVVADATGRVWSAGGAAGGYAGKAVAQVSGAVTMGAKASAGAVTGAAGAAVAGVQIAGTATVQGVTAVANTTVGVAKTTVGVANTTVTKLTDAARRGPREGTNEGDMREDNTSPTLMQTAPGQEGEDRRNSGPGCGASV